MAIIIIYKLRIQHYLKMYFSPLNSCVFSPLEAENSVNNYNGWKIANNDLVFKGLANK